MASITVKVSGASSSYTATIEDYSDRGNHKTVRDSSNGSIKGTTYSSLGWTLSVGSKIIITTGNCSATVTWATKSNVTLLKDSTYDSELYNSYTGKCTAGGKGCILQINGDTIISITLGSGSSGGSTVPIYCKRGSNCSSFKIGTSASSYTTVTTTTNTVVFYPKSLASDTLKVFDVRTSLSGSNRKACMYYSKTATSAEASSPSQWFDVNTTYASSESRVINPLFYGRWVRVVCKQESTTYTITYDKNGGSGTNHSETYDIGETATIEECDFTPPEGLEFEGWATSATGNVVYHPGDEYSANASQTLYAKWTTYCILRVGSYGYHRGWGSTDIQLHGIKTLTFTREDTGETQIVYAGDNLGNGGNTVATSAIGKYTPGLSAIFLNFDSYTSSSPTYIRLVSAELEPGYATPVFGFPRNQYPNSGISPTWEVGITGNTRINMPAVRTDLAPGPASNRGSRTINLGATFVGGDYYVSIYGNDGTTVMTTLTGSINQDGTMTSVTIPTPASVGITPPTGFTTSDWNGYSLTKYSTNADYTGSGSEQFQGELIGTTYALYPVWKSNSTSVKQWAETEVSNVYQYYTCGEYILDLPPISDETGWEAAGYVSNTTSDIPAITESAPTYQPNDNLHSTSPLPNYWFAVYSREVTLSYNANGGSGTLPSNQTGTQYHNCATATARAATSTVSFVLANASLTLSNHEFKGWLPTASTPWAQYMAVGSTYSPNPTSTSVVVYAAWKPTTITITYKPNGGTGGDKTQTPYIGGGFTTLSMPSDWSRPGYTLIGWNVRQDWTPETDHAGDIGYDLNVQYIAPSNDLILYAVWYEEFKWTDNDSVNIIAGQPTTKATAAKWNNLEYKIRWYKVRGYVPNAEVSGNPMKIDTQHFSRAAIALGVDIEGENPGDIIKAADFIALKTELNRAPLYFHSYDGTR